MSDLPLRRFSRKHWRERRILYAAGQQRKRRAWLVVGALVVMLVSGLPAGLSVFAFPDLDTGSTIMTGE